MTKSFLKILIALFLCASCTTPDLPDIKSLDKIADANSSILYDWNEEYLENEESIPNKKDLEIKINRKVSFSYKGKKFILYPFFKKTSDAQQIAILHFLLTEESLDISKLKDVSFKDLTVLEKGRAYYFHH
ncbi:MAG: hypothetical protein ACO1N0_16425 [Fluviicola sp.]